MTPAQQKVVDAVEAGARLVATYSGVYVDQMNGFRRGRCLHPVTQRAVIEHFGSRLLYVYTRSERFKVPMQFYCLREHLDKAVENRHIVHVREVS